MQGWTRKYGLVWVSRSINSDVVPIWACEAAGRSTRLRGACGGILAGNDLACQTQHVPEMEDRDGQYREYEQHRSRQVECHTQFAALVVPDAGIGDHHQGKVDRQMEVSATRQVLVREGADAPCRPNLQSQQQDHQDSEMAHEVPELRHSHGMDVGCLRHGSRFLPGGAGRRSGIDRPPGIRFLWMHLKTIEFEDFRHNVGIVVVTRPRTDMRLGAGGRRLAVAGVSGNTCGDFSIVNISDIVSQADKPVGAFQRKRMPDPLFRGCESGGG
jgi:hypothetical protein